MWSHVSISIQGFSVVNKIVPSSLLRPSNPSFSRSSRLHISNPSIPSPSIVLRLPSAPASSSSSSRRSHHHHHQLRRTSSTSSTSTTTATSTSTKNHKLLEVNFLRHDFIPVQIIATTFHNQPLTQP